MNRSAEALLQSAFQQRGAHLQGAEALQPGNIKCLAPPIKPQKGTQLSTLAVLMRCSHH